MRQRLIVLIVLIDAHSFYQHLACLDMKKLYVTRCSTTLPRRLWVGRSNDQAYAAYAAYPAYAARARIFHTSHAVRVIKPFLLADIGEGCAFAVIELSPSCCPRAALLTTHEYPSLSPPSTITRVILTRLGFPAAVVPSRLTPSAGVQGFAKSRSYNGLYSRELALSNLTSCARFLRTRRPSR